eukprot:922656-Pelagomonas_calceolata.AAC.1
MFRPTLQGALPLADAAVVAHPYLHASSAWLCLLWAVVLMMPRLTTGTGRGDLCPWCRASLSLGQVASAHGVAPDCGGSTKRIEKEEHVPVRRHA